MKHKDLTAFSIKEVSKKLNSINIQINLQHQIPFPKPKEQLLSWFSYQNRWVKILPNGYFNKARLVTSLIDFSFIRSLVADTYSKEGAPSYDPVSLFLCDLFRRLEGYPYMKDFCKTLHDKFNGASYRIYAGISDDHIPCESDFSNFRIRIGEERYNRIFAILVEILIALDMLTANIISHDGTLVHSFARYRGCNYATSDCACIRVSGDFISHTRYRILKLLENPHSIPIDKELRSFAKCPKGTLPNGVKPPSIQVCAFKLLPFNPETFDENDQTTKLFGLEDELKNHNLMLVPIRTNISKIDLNLIDNPVYLKCPRMPYDLDAKIGYRRSKYNPDKKEKVFGYQLIISTSIEPDTGLEFPVACITKPGSAHDGNFFIPIKEQIKWQHPSLKTYIDIGDAGFDETENYNYARAEGSIPIFDYNTRNEKLSPDILYQRGYDQYGAPFAPCKVTCHPNGYDKEHKRLTFVCSKQCIKTNQIIPEPIQNCPHLSNSLGYTVHKSISENPRLFCEIPRGTSRYKKIRNLRSSSERTNSTAKSDMDILQRPKVFGLKRTAILAQIACIVTLLKRFLTFVVRITIAWRKFRESGETGLPKSLQLKKIPPFLLSLIQRK